MWIFTTIMGEFQHKAQMKEENPKDSKVPQMQLFL